MSKSQEQAVRKRKPHVREQAATLARLRLATIVESSDDAIIGKDMNGIITDWNSGAERLYGYSAGEAIGKPISLLMPPDRADDFAKIMRKIEHGDIIKNFETIREKKDGTCVEVSLTISPIIDTKGRIVGASTIARDITERKQFDEALRQKDRELIEAQRLAGLGSWHWDARNQIVTWSEELYRIAGLDPALPAPIYEERPRFLTTESWERLRPAIEKALRDGTSYELDLEHVRPDGSTIWARARGEVQRDLTGHIVGLRGTAQDITERRLAERELALANERLRLAMEAGKSMGWDWDIKSGRDTWFGDLKSVVGMPSETYVGSVEELHRYIHSEDRVRVWEAAKDAMENKKPYAAEYRILRPDGTVRWVAVKGKFYYSPDGEPERMLGMKVDITERKLVEGALRESEERLRLAVQVGKMYAIDWDVASDVVIRSEEASQILGLAGERINVTHRQMLAGIHPEDRAAFIASITEFAPESPNHQINFRLLRPDSSVLWLERTGHAFFDEQGRMVRMVGMVADVTERKLAEEALSKVGGRLIEAHEEERSRIARELHDDIGQRLALLISDMDGLEKDLPDSAVEVRNHLREQLKRVHEIASDTQAMSHQLHSSKLRLLGIVAAAKGFCQELSEQQKVEIDFTHADIPPAVPEEISLCLFRVMQEALHNAVKHSGVRHFQVQLRRASGEIQLTIRDSGVGFNPDEAMMNNRGLGLISMRERISLVRGTFSVRSEPQRGTEIFIRVPFSAGMGMTQSAG